MTCFPPWTNLESSYLSHCVSSLTKHDGNPIQVGFAAAHYVSIASWLNLWPRLQIFFLLAWQYENCMYPIYTANFQASWTHKLFYGRIDVWGDDWDGLLEKCLVEVLCSSAYVLVLRDLSRVLICKTASASAFLGKSASSNLRDIKKPAIQQSTDTAANPYKML